jgi:protein phosphatase
MAIEDGILLLCSDGLSDRNLVESSWQDYAERVLKSDIPLTEAVQSWLALAHRQNGDDNISLVLMSCQVSPTTTTNMLGSQLVNIARDDLQDPAEDLAAEPKFRLSRVINLFLFLTTAIGLLAGVAIAIAFFYPDLVENWRRQFFPNQSSQIELNRHIIHNS